MSNQDRAVQRDDYSAFCARYNLDPETEDARAQFEEAQRQLEILERAAARQEAKK